MSVDLELSHAWVPAVASLVAYPPDAYVRRWAGPVCYAIFGIGALVHGSMSLYRDSRIQEFGLPIDARIGGFEPDERRVCYEIYVDAESRYYGPNWYEYGDGCVTVSRETYQAIGGQKHVTVLYDPNYPQFNRLEPVTARAYWEDSLIVLIGIGLMAAARHSGGPRRRV